jgi:translin
MELSSDYFNSLKEKVDFLTNLKDDIVYKGIKINKFSKSIIYSLIRDDRKTAEEYVKQFKSMIEEYKNLVNRHPQFWKNAEVSFQEYAEAMIFYFYLKENRIVSHKELDIDEISYLLGLMDFT